MANNFKFFKRLYYMHCACLMHVSSVIIAVNKDTWSVDPLPWFVCFLAFECTSLFVVCFFIYWVSALQAWHLHGSLSWEDCFTIHSQLALLCKCAIGNALYGLLCFCWPLLLLLLGSRLVCQPSAGPGCDNCSQSHRSLGIWPCGQVSMPSQSRGEAPCSTPTTASSPAG